MKKSALFCLAAVFALSACSVSVSDFLGENVKGRPDVLGITVEADTAQNIIETKDGKYYINVETRTTIRVKIENPRKTFFAITVLDNGIPAGRDIITREWEGTNEIVLTIISLDRGAHNLVLQLAASGNSPAFESLQLPEIFVSDFYEINIQNVPGGTLTASFPTLKINPLSNGGSCIVPEGVKVSFTAKPGLDRLPEPLSLEYRDKDIPAFYELITWAARSSSTMRGYDTNVSIQFGSFSGITLQSLIAESADEDTIYLNGTCYLSQNSITIPPPKKITLIAESTVVDFVRAKDTISLFEVNGGALTLKTQGTGSAITLDGDLVNASCSLISVYASGTLTLSGNVTLKDNKNFNGVFPYCGGGVLLYNGTFTMYDGTIQNNTANYGGGVDVSTGGKFIMYGGTITGNTAVTTPNGGAGVYVEPGGAFEKHGGTVTDEIYRAP